MGTKTEHTGLEKFKWNDATKTIIDRYLFTVGRVHDKRVLDFGSGNGHGCMLMKTYGAKYVWGFDIGKEAHEQSIMTFAGVPGIDFCNTLHDVLVCATEEENKMDLIVSFEVFEHIPYKELDENILPKLKKVLKKGGELIFSTPINRDGGKSNDPYHVNEMTPKVLTALMDKHFKEWDLYSTVEVMDSLWFSTKITSGISLNSRCFLVVAKNE